MASPSPGQGGIVTATTSSGSAPSERNWKCVPALMLALSSSHAAGIGERFGGEGARDALRDLAAPHRIDDGHVRFGYLFQCITVRRDP